jgi:hypothetical protein
MSAAGGHATVSAAVRAIAVAAVTPAALEGWMSEYGRDGGAPPARHGASGLVITLAAVLVLVLCGGGALALYLMHAKDSVAGGQSSPAATGSGSAGPRANAAPSYDAGSIVKGQCVANDGTGDAPKLRVVNCAPGSYLVLARLDGTTDTNRCTMVPGSTHDFFYQTTPSTSDFVLCLKKQ